MGFPYDINSSIGLPGPTSLSSALLRALPGDQRLVSVIWAVCLLWKYRGWNTTTMLDTVVILIFKPSIRIQVTLPPKKNNQDLMECQFFVISPMTLRKNVKVVSTRGWQLKDFLFSPLLGELIQFDEHQLEMVLWFWTYRIYRYIV